MGKNTIDSIMKKMKLNSPLIDLCPEKRITNHNARKTVVKKLKNVPEYQNVRSRISRETLLRRVSMITILVMSESSK